MTSFKTLDDLAPAGKRILVRVDLNVPMEDGHVADSTRLERILPTIRELSQGGGRVILLSHFGRPKGVDKSQSLKPVTTALSAELGSRIAFCDDCIGPHAAKAVAAMQDGDVLCLENTRFHAGEEKNDPAFVAALATLGEAYVNDAFSCAHRAHASTEGLAHILPAYAGRTMEAELKALDAALGNPARPVAAIVGGSKVSSKLDLLGNLVARVDCLIIGGGMANTFLFAQGKGVGKSLCEKDLADTAREIIAKAKSSGCEIVLPVDAVVAKEFKAQAQSRTIGVDAVGEDEMILDAGPETEVADQPQARRDEDPRLERAGWRLRDGALRSWHHGDRPACGGARDSRGADRGWRRRRHRLCAQSGWRRRRHDLCLDGGRRISRMDGRQALAGCPSPCRESIVKRVKAAYQD